MAQVPKELSAPGRLAVATRSLSKRYGSNMALDDVSLTVPEGSVYVLVGPNGAGKSTALKVLLDLVVADRGSAEVLGLDTRTQSAAVRAHIGYVPERDEVGYGWLEVGALIRYHAAYYRCWDASYAGELSRLFSIRSDMKLGRLSKGQQRRVQLLLALAHHPPVLVMDEPTDGLDPLMREETLAALAAHLARFPTTILLSTHQVHEAERLGDHLGVMCGGQLHAQTSRDALRRYLRRYQFEVPDGWAPSAELAQSVIRRNGSRREVAWTLWGEESEVVERLRDSGATLRHVEPLSLADATLALLERHADRPLSSQDRETVHAGV
ncbi:MAG TPA: ABC transporter ATP-binding protein [Longimicrobiales bacterium]|nr:ABC transporter ATP-binding protein [Longimicrobiales bacterium]